MKPIERDSSLGKLQRYVAEMEQERGFAEQTVVQKCLLLGEEVGEVFKAVRKRERMPFDGNAPTAGVDEELADVLIYLCSIANRCGVDLGEAFLKKEEINKARIWR